MLKTPPEVRAQMGRGRVGNCARGLRLGAAIGEGRRGRSGEGPARPDLGVKRHGPAQGKQGQLKGVGWVRG